MLDGGGGHPGPFPSGGALGLRHRLRGGRAEGRFSRRRDARDAACGGGWGEGQGTGGGLGAQGRGGAV